jgi:MFS superfamily sulfate permease-like transporter
VSSNAISAFISFATDFLLFRLGLLRLGFLDAVLSRALLRGFISAVALVILVAQVIPMLGLHSHVLLETTPEKFVWIIENIGDTHRVTALLSAFALAILIGTKTFKSRLISSNHDQQDSSGARKYIKLLAYVPEVLLVVLGSTLLAGGLRLDLQGLQVLGNVSAGSASIQAPFLHTRDFLTRCIGTSVRQSFPFCLDRCERFF